MNTGVYRAVAQIKSNQLTLISPYNVDSYIGYNEIKRKKYNNNIHTSCILTYLNLHVYIIIATLYVVRNSLSHSLELFYFVLLLGDLVMKVPKQFI